MGKNSNSSKNNMEEVGRRENQERWFAFAKWASVLERRIIEMD